jgi:hypothetical protein
MAENYLAIVVRRFSFPWRIQGFYPYCWTKSSTPAVEIPGFGRQSGHPDP